MTITVPISFSQAEPVSYTFGVTLVVCRKCSIRRGVSVETGADLAAEAAQVAKGTGIKVRQVACLGRCDKGLNAALMVPHGWNYIFNGLEVSDARDLIEGATALAFSDDGQLRWADWSVSLRKALSAQIPSWDAVF